MSKQNQRQTIGIIGTGNFAKAFASRLHLSGYDVILGSRKPTERTFASTNDCLCSVDITTIDECIQKADIVVLAIHSKHLRNTLSPYVEMLAEKICIDVSNPSKLSKGSSLAEQIQHLISRAFIVKAFNVISAYEMEIQSSGGSKNVYIASNHLEAREKVSNLARDIGFIPKDFGILKNARQIEKIPLELFPEWKYPIGFALFVFIIWYLYAIFIYFVEKTSYSWEQIFVKVTNKPLCMTAITVLSCTYLPSSVAAIFQIYNGTKHIRFPTWLDAWLRTRKQLGLLAFILVCIHVIMSVLVMSPTYLKSWYHDTDIVIPKNFTSDLHFPIRTWMNWKGESACLIGIIAFVGMCVLASTSIKSVGDSLNWREWHCIQSQLGHVVLFLSLCHVIIMGAPGWINGGPLKMVRSITFLSSLLPLTTITLKIVFCMPVLGCYVKKIRNGWERKRKTCRGKCSGFEGHVLETKYSTLNENEINNDFTPDFDSKDDTEVEYCQCAATNLV